MPSKKAIELAMIHYRGKDWREKYWPDLLEFIRKYNQDDADVTYDIIINLATLIDEAVQPMVDALKNQRELWRLAEGILNASDDNHCRVRFMELHDPIGNIDSALRGWEATDEK